MAPPTLCYLSIDSLETGVGTSQVLRYVEGLAARGWFVELHSFEPGPLTPATEDRLRAAGIDWHGHPFGRPGSVGGFGRALRGGWHVRRAPLVHGRGDLAALGASLRRARPFVWDMRGFWVDERIATGSVRPGSAVERVLRRVERRLARRAARIVTLSHAAAAELAARQGGDVASRVVVIPTCVDLERFPASPLPPPPHRVLLAGTLNVRYDVPTMVRLVESLRTGGDITFAVVTPEPGPWTEALVAAGAELSAATPAAMPAVVAAAAVGLSVLRRDATSAGSVPTKIGELLAAGRPVVVSAGQGDLDGIVAEHRCGVVLDPSGELAESAAQIRALLADPGTPARCRLAAERHFDLEWAVDQLAALHAEVSGEARR